MEAPRTRYARSVDAHVAYQLVGRGPVDVLVSSTVKDLVAGSGVAFAERGAHELEGIPGEWALYAVESA